MMYRLFTLSFKLSLFDSRWCHTYSSYLFSHFCRSVYNILAVGRTIVGNIFPVFYFVPQWSLLSPNGLRILPVVLVSPVRPCLFFPCGPCLFYVFTLYYITFYIVACHITFDTTFFYITLQFHITCFTPHLYMHTHLHHKHH
jgi:hypothetical protein